MFTCNSNGGRALVCTGPEVDDSVHPRGPTLIEFAAIETANDNS
jgi:hypothetical protein